MSRKVLIPLDGSNFSEHALPLGLDLARRLGAEVHLVRVHEPLAPLTYAGEVPIFDPGWEHELRTREEEYLRGWVDVVGERAGLRAHGALLDGTAVDALASYMQEVEVDLVVMTTHGRGGLSRFWLGSVADGLVRRATAPLLLLRPEEEQVDLDRVPSLSRILVPLDGTGFSRQVLDRVVVLARTLGADLTLLRVVVPVFTLGVPLPPASAAEVPPALERERSFAAEYLESVAEEVGDRSLEVRTAVVVHQQPAEGIVEYAESHDVDLIAMATHGRGGLARLTLGSVADKVLRSSRTPLLLYRPSGERAASAGATPPARSEG